MSEATAASTTKGKTEYIKVHMEDGRDVDFPVKRRMLKSPLIENDKLGVRIDWQNGLTRTFWIPEHQLKAAAVHGYSQKLGDSVAGPDPETKERRDEDDMCLEIEGLHERLVAPGADWNMVSEGGGFSGASVLMKALIEWSGQTAEQVKEFLKTKAPKEKLALRDESTAVGKTGITIKAIVDRLEAEKKAKAKEGVDVKAVLAGLPMA